MSWLEFIAAIAGSIASLAWPAAVFGSVWLFRKELRSALPKLRLKHGDTEVSFRLDRAEEEILRIPTAAQDQLEPPPIERDHFTRLAEISPRAAILDARARIERRIVELAENRGISEFKRKRPALLIKELFNRNVLGSATRFVLEDLRQIGNSVAHGVDSEVTIEDAVRYGELTSIALATLDQQFEPANDQS